MTLRPPTAYGFATDGNPLEPLALEIMAEKAAALGRAGEAAQHALDRLEAHEGAGAERDRLRLEAARAVHAWFIQRELCGLRRHAGVIEALSIPREVLARLGAS